MEIDSRTTITMRQSETEAQFTGDTAFGFAFTRLPDGNIQFTQNSSGSWTKYEVCCALEALQQALCKTEEGKSVFVDGMNMFIYELQELFKRKDEDAPRVKVFIDENKPYKAI